MIEILNSRRISNQGYSTLELELEIDGDRHLARLDAEPKLWLWEKGIVFLGTEFRDVVPIIEVDGETLYGFTDDEKVFAEYDRFGQSVKNGTFKPD